MKHQVWVVLSLVVVLAACAPVRQQKPKELELPPQRSVHTGFSLLPLDEKGWLIGAQQPQILILGKLGSDPDESFVLRAFTVVLPDFNSSDEFMGFAKTAIGETDPTRFKKITQESKTVIVNGQSCVSVKSMEEDLGANKRTSRTDPMLIEAYSLVCPHPQKNIAIVVAYSHRYYSGQADPESAKKAATIFEAVEFRDF
jgi:hypothetical protein